MAQGRPSVTQPARSGRAGPHAACSLTLAKDGVRAARTVQDAAGPAELVWFVELDAGTERTQIWEGKAERYAAATAAGSFFGERRWSVLAVVPSMRRARSVTSAVSKRGAGTLVWVAVQGGFEDGKAFEPVLARADELAAAPRSEPPRWTLLGEVAATA